MSEGFDWTCCVCGKPTSLSPFCAQFGVYRSTCVTCMSEDPDTGYITYERAPEALIRTALTYTPSGVACAQGRALGEAELKRRESIQ